MEALISLLAHAKERPLKLKLLQQEGVPIVGYAPTEYMPEELVYACGAIPVGLIRGGDHEAVISSQSCLFRYLDTFCRAQIGYRLSGKEPLYQLPDLLVVPITDRNITAIAESWQLYTNVEVFKFGVPRYTGIEYAFEYYLDGLKLLAGKLEELTGRKIDEDRLKQEIQLTNKINSLLEKISYSRTSKHPPISGKDFIKLNHASYYTDRKIFLSSVKAISEELTTVEPSTKKGPRIMLVGSTLAEGDNNLIDTLENSGANIVIEEFSEGVRHYQSKINTNGDLLKALADAYLEKRIPPAFFHAVIRKRFDHLLNLAKEFKVDGVVWYSLMYRDSYDREGLLFSKFVEKELGIPLLKIVSDYDSAEIGQMKTRIETFIDMIK